MIIEQHYGRPMDIEWGKSGDDGKLYILQARPETVKSQQSGHVMEKYRLKQYGKSSPTAAPSARRSAPARSASSRTPPRWTASRPATCSSPT
jgi:phosphoenolpyruvate synthase/pyruvate phosphate dikinase